MKNDTNMFRNMEKSDSTNQIITRGIGRPWKIKHDNDEIGQQSFEEG